MPFKVEKPGDIVFTLERTMKLSEWIALSEQLKNGAGRVPGWPASEFIMDIQEMSSKAKREFYGGDQ